MNRVVLEIAAGILVGVVAPAGAAQDLPVDLSGYSIASGVQVARHEDRLTVAWPGVR